MRIRHSLSVALALSVCRAAAADTLSPVTSFGSNPGNLEMFVHVPANLPPHAPLVVVLHGCTQTASSMQEAGWDTLADAAGFAVLYPQQQSANNSSECFNWYDPANQARGSGEPESIVQMIDALASSSTIDTSRVYIAGFSAGGAYVPVMLATYPDRFAAGSIMEGIPYKCATSENAAFTCMDMQSTSEQTPAAWSALVKSGDSGFAGPWPRVQIWHGSADYTVFTQNATELVKQWTDVHGLGQTATSTETIGSATHTEYADSSGTVQVEEYLVNGMGHAVAIGNDSIGTCPATAGTYFTDKGICSTLRAAEFFGLAVGGGTGSGGGGGSGTGSGSDNGDPPAFGGCNAGGHDGALPVLVCAALLGLRRRRVRTAALVTAALAASTGAALAQPAESDPAPAPTDAPPAAPAHVVGLHAGLIYTDTHVTAQESGNFLAVGWFPANDFTLYAGLGVSYNPNGGVKDSLGLTGKMSNTLASDMAVGAGYFVIDNPKRNIFMGPEVVWLANIAPESFADVSVIEVAWAIRYGLWKTPVAIGTDLGVTFTGVYGAKGPMIATAPFGLHIVYSFN